MYVGFGSVIKRNNIKVERAQCSVTMLAKLMRKNFDIETS
jgi:hypothetical protein